MARFIADRGLSVKPAVRFQTANGQIETHLLDDGRVEVDMGVPKLVASEVPFDASRATSCQTIAAATPTACSTTTVRATS